MALNLIPIKSKFFFNLLMIYIKLGAVFTIDKDTITKYNLT